MYLVYDFHIIKAPHRETWNCDDSKEGKDEENTNFIINKNVKVDYGWVLSYFMICTMLSVILALTVVIN